MKFDHRVKIGGVWYEAGAEVNSSAPSVTEEAPKVETKEVSVKRSEKNTKKNS